MNFKAKFLTIFFLLGIVFSFLSIANFTSISAGTIRCAYGRCLTNNDCDNGGQCIDMNGDGKKECSNGICNTNADCYGAQNGGVAVCRDENADGLKECANAFCPIGKTVPGANCDCSAGRTCGQTCSASVGLCGDGKSTCRYIVGPACTNTSANPNGTPQTTYCVPGGAPGITVTKCVSRDQWNSYALYNGNNPTVADIAAACASILCKPADPAPALLITPANGSTVNYSVVSGSNYSVPLTYNVNTSWGTACPANVNKYDVQVSYNCTGIYNSLGQATQVTGVVKSGTYCWRVVKDNGSGVKIPSTVNQFRVIDDTVVVSTSGIKADVCSAQFSGVAGSPLVSNPIDYGFTFTSVPGNKYREAWIAMIPDMTPYNDDCLFKGRPDIVADNVCKYQESGTTVEERVILQKATLSKGVVFKIILDAAGNPVSTQAYNGSSWNSATAGNVSGLGGTLLNFKTNTTASVSGNSLTANFQIQFDTVLPGKYSFFAAALISDSLGNIKTSYSTPSYPYEYYRVSAFAGNRNWGIDLNPPTATSAFTSVKYLPNGQFQINWNEKEANTFKLKSFITRDSIGAGLQDTTPGAGDINFNDTLPNIPNASTFENGTLKFSDITTANGYVDQSNLGTRTYQDGDPTKQSNYLFYTYAQDIACNQKVSSTSATLQKPWVLSYNGGLSAGKGVIGLALPNSLSQLSDNLKDINSNTILDDQQSVFLSTYGAISGTADLPIGKISKFQEYVTKYEDLTIKPPLDSGFTAWYDYMYDLVSKNSSSLITTKTGNVSLNVNTSSFLGVLPDAKKHVVIDGNLTVESGVVCDTQTIFFVKGNLTTPMDSAYPTVSLRIKPNFTTSNNNTGCMFVTQKDILIDNGPRASTVSIDGAQLSYYDLVEAALITDAKFITLKDVINNTEKGDGLTIKGTVVSDDVVLQRDVNLNANQFQPAQVFYFDPRYREFFKNDLNYNKYSIREVGFASE